jgi:hypothetical protein
LGFVGILNLCTRARLKILWPWKLMWKLCVTA